MLGKKFTQYHRSVSVSLTSTEIVVLLLLLLVYKKERSAPCDSFMHCTAEESNDIGIDRPKLHYCDYCVTPLMGARRIFFPGGGTFSVTA